MCYIIRNEHYYHECSYVNSPLDNVIFADVYDVWNYIDRTIKYKISTVDINETHPHIHIGSNCVGLYFYENDFINPSESYWFNIIQVHKYEKDADNQDE